MILKRHGGECTKIDFGNSITRSIFGFKVGGSKTN